MLFEFAFGQNFVRQCQCRKLEKLQHMMPSPFQQFFKLKSNDRQNLWLKQACIIDETSQDFEAQQFLRISLKIVKHCNLVSLESCQAWATSPL